MKKLFILICCFCLLLSVNACSSKQKQIIEYQQKTLKNISYIIPINWNEKVDENNNLHVKYAYLENSMYTIYVDFNLLNISNVINVSNIDTSQDNLLNNLKIGFDNSGKDKKDYSSEITTITVANLDALKFTYRCETDDFKDEMIVSYMIPINDTTILNYTYIIRETYKDKYENIISTISNNIAIIPETDSTIEE